MTDDIALSEAERGAGIVRCDAAPCCAASGPGRAGACDRYANEDGKLVRVDPLVLLAKPDLARVAFVEGSAGGAASSEGRGAFVTGIGATTTYPDYKPRPSSCRPGMTASTCDGRDRGHLQLLRREGENDTIAISGRAGGRAGGRARRWATSPRRNNGSQMLSPGRRCIHLTGGSKKEASSPAKRSWRSATAKPSSSRSTAADRGVQATGRRSSTARSRSVWRVGAARPAIACSRRMEDHVDEVIVVDDHITGVLSEHQGGRFLDIKPAASGCAAAARRRAAISRSPSLAWLGHPMSAIRWRSSRRSIPSRPGRLKLLMVSTTGRAFAWFELDHDLRPQPAAMPAAVRHVVERIAENCEPALCTVLFMAGAALAARRSHREPRATDALGARHADQVTLGGVPAYGLAGRGIT